MPASRSLTISGALSGMPGDLTTSSAARIRSSEWCLLVGDLPLVQFGFVAVGDPPLVGEENVESFLLGEDRGAVAADAAAQDNYFFMGLSDFKRYQGNGRQQQRHDPETGDDLGFEETLFLVVMVQGDMSRMRRPSPYLRLVYLK